MRVLLLEDKKEVADSLMDVFEFRKIDAVHVATVQAAKDVYSVDEFDVMVIDYELPDGTGLDFLASISGVDKAVTVLYSGLERSRELAASGLSVDHQVDKQRPGDLLRILDEEA